MKYSTILKFRSILWRQVIEDTDQGTLVFSIIESDVLVLSSKQLVINASFSITKRDVLPDLAMG